jgi:transposase
MHSNCIKKLLGLEDVISKNVVHADSYVNIFIETEPSIQVCPHCGQQTKRIHDYRSQTIKDLPFQLKHTYLILKKRRYVRNLYSMKSVAENTNVSVKY